MIDTSRALSIAVASVGCMLLVKVEKWLIAKNKDNIFGKDLNEMLFLAIRERREARRERLRNTPAKRV